MKLLKLMKAISFTQMEYSMGVGVPGGWESLGDGCSRGMGVPGDGCSRGMGVPGVWVL